MHQTEGLMLDRMAALVLTLDADSDFARDKSNARSAAGAAVMCLETASSRLSRTLLRAEILHRGRVCSDG